MKFTLAQLEDLFYNIQVIVDYIENSKYDERRFKLHLSNGEHLNLSFQKESIAHLLGVNTSYLSSTNIFKETNSFELLKRLIQEPYKIFNLQKDNVLNFNQLFSPFISEKINNFRENIKLNLEDIEFICKYDSSRTYINSDDFKKYDYVIVKKLSNDKIGLLCLVRNSGYFAPMSSQIFDDYESAKEKLYELTKHQEITLVSGISINNIFDDYSKDFYLNLYDKKAKIKNLINYKQDFDTSIDVADDFQYSISKLTHNRMLHNEDYQFVNKIVSCISEGKLIEVESYEGSYLMPIVNAFNDIICSSSLTKDENSETYTQMKTNLENFKKQLAKLQKQNFQLNEENNVLKIENDNLKTENDYLTDTHSKVLELLNNPRTK